MLHVVLLEPEIPANTGNIGRTCVVTGSVLHLIRPLGFSLDDKLLHRAGLGYWNSLDIRVHDGWEEFLRDCNLDITQADEPQIHLLTKKARKTYSSARYRDGDYLVFGKESSGIADEILASMPDCCERIPMLADEFSIVDSEQWSSESQNAGYDADSPIMEQDICGNFIDPNDYRISALNLSNAAAIVIYEALRQTGFPGMEQTD